MVEAVESSRRLAEALEAVLHDEADLLPLLEGEDRFEGALTACLHGLWHFEIDADIRAMDATYRQMQEAGMRELIRRLRLGLSSKQLAEIDFLRWPDVP